jgi:acetyl esterase/lipase
MTSSSPTEVNLLSSSMYNDMRVHLGIIIFTLLHVGQAFQTTSPILPSLASLHRTTGWKSVDEGCSHLCLDPKATKNDRNRAMDVIEDIVLTTSVTGWKKLLHNWLRDSGGFRWVMNTATRLIAAPQFYQDYPHCFPDFIRISGSEYPWLLRTMRTLQIIPDHLPDVNFAKESYGSHHLQQAEILVNQPQKLDNGMSTLPPLFFFLHGGAWGSGFPTMYRLISVPFLQRGYRAIILGYRTYPDGNVEEQVDDLANAVRHFSQQYGGIGGDKPTIVLMGHSSGAHITLLAALQGRIPCVDAIIAQSGVYDCAAQVEHEQTLGIDQLSPLSPVTGMTRASMDRYSPTWLVSEGGEIENSPFPPLLLIHGEDDTVVLPSSSTLFYEKVRRRIRAGHPLELKILPDTDHKDPILDTLVGGPTQNVTFEWLKDVL